MQLFLFPKKESQNFFAYCSRLFEAARVAALQPEEFEEYISTMVTERDIKNYISYAHEKGKAEGLAEGMVIGKAEGKTEGLAEGEAIGEVKGIHKTARNINPKAFLRRL